MKVAEYYDRLAPDYHKHYDGTSNEYPANSIRLHYILERLKYLKVKSVYEIGVGEGTPLREIHDKLGIAVSGCDVSMEMVKIARAKFDEGIGVIAHIDMETAPVAIGEFDAVIATGVLPHVTNEDGFIRNIYGLLAPGGSAIVEFRNSLFSLFTFNRYTIDFIMDELLRGVTQRVRDEVFDFLMGQVVINPSRPPKSEFDDISRFHNPFELQNTFAKHGLQTTGFLWYHAHPAPPCLEKDLGEEFRKEALKLEGKNDWRGMFLCSAGLIEVRK